MYVQFSSGGVNSRCHASCDDDGIRIPCFGGEKSHCVAIDIHQGTCWNRHVVFRQDRLSRADSQDQRSQRKRLRLSAKVLDDLWKVMTVLLGSTQN